MHNLSMSRVWRCLIPIGFCVLFFTCLISIAAHAQTEAEQLDSELPERVQIPVLDVTIVQLVPRQRFEDSARPRIGVHQGRYAKERAWGLPPSATLKRFERSTSISLPEIQVRLDIAPRIPGSLLYDAFLVRNFAEGYGIAYLGQDFLSGSLTTDGRQYRTSHARGSLDYHHREGGYVNADVFYLAKNSEWLLATSPTETDETPGFRLRDASLLEGNLRWTEPISSGSRLDAFVDASRYQIRMSNAEQERVTDARLHLQIATPWPFLYPLRFGADLEFLSAEETVHAAQPTWDATTFRLFVHDSMIHMGPFVADARYELVALWEPDDTGEGKREYFPNPELTVTTEINSLLSWQIAAGRSVERPRPRALYLDHDYTVVSPRLKAEKTWYAETSLRLGSRTLEAVLRAGVERTDDLIYLESIPDSDLIAWKPAEMDVRLPYAAFSLRAIPVPQWVIEVRYRHEEHVPIRLGDEIPRHIPLRPLDTGELVLTYRDATGWSLGLTGRYVGKRQSDAFTDVPMEAYLLLGPDFRYRLSDSTEVFARGRFSLGERRDFMPYVMPQSTADLGVTLRF